MATVKVTDESFEADVLKASQPVLVDFWAEWCGPCKQIGPALEQIAEELGGQVTIAKVNIDDSPMVPSKLGVKGIPTLMLFKDGQMAIVHGVGYDQPSFSHFSSMAFWQTAAPNSGEAYGWLGRLAAVLPQRLGHGWPGRRRTRHRHGPHGPGRPAGHRQPTHRDPARPP